MVEQEKFDSEEYIKNHKGNLHTLLKIYWSNKPIWKSYFFWSAVFLSVITQLVVFCTNTSFFNAIEYIGNQMLNIMPNILGFNLGGYVLLIGMNSQNILDEITEPVKPSKYSLFQKQSSVFAFSILIQASSILISFLLLGAIHLGENVVLPAFIPAFLNFVGSLFLNFISFYSLTLIGQIVLNIFNFGQILHFFVRLDRLEKKSRANKQGKK